MWLCVCVCMCVGSGCSAPTADRTSPAPWHMDMHTGAASSLRCTPGSLIWFALRHSRIPCSRPRPRPRRPWRCRHMRRRVYRGTMRRPPPGQASQRPPAAARTMASVCFGSMYCTQSLPRPTCTMLCHASPSPAHVRPSTTSIARIVRSIPCLPACLPACYCCYHYCCCMSIRLPALHPSSCPSSPPPYQGCEWARRLTRALHSHSHSHACACACNDQKRKENKATTEPQTRPQVHDASIPPNPGSPMIAWPRFETNVSRSWPRHARVRRR